MTAQNRLLGALLKLLAVGRVCTSFFWFGSYLVGIQSSNSPEGYKKINELTWFQQLKAEEESNQGSVFLWS
jgi:hypothetical protein